MDNTYKKIIKIALLGTERSSIPEPLQSELRQIGISTQNRDSADVILQASTVLNKMQRAGYQPIQNITHLPPTAPLETLEICSTKSTRHLMMMMTNLGGSNNEKNNLREALPEFLATLANVSKRLPEEVLPDILELGKNKQQYWTMFRKIIGARGKWLAQQNPEWQYIMLNTNLEHWETGTKLERLALLRHWRENDPTKARELLATTWSLENINDKLAFLKILKINLSIDDETFLEKSLDARRKEERKLAAKLLSKIAHSQLVQRMYQRVQTLLTIYGRRLQVELPETLDASMKRDGIDANTKWIKGGLKASQLGQMLAILPPAMMEVHLNLPPRKILEQYWKSDWRELLLQATLEATAIHNDNRWADELFKFWIEKSKGADLSDFMNINPLLENLSEDLFNKIAIMGLSSTNGMLNENHPIVHLLKLSPHRWQPDLTKIFVGHMQNWMLSVQSVWSGWHYQGILRKAAFHSDARLLPLLERNWPKDKRVWSNWEQNVEEFLNILRFRKMMIEELHI